MGFLHTLSCRFVIRRELSGKEEEEEYDDEDGDEEEDDEEEKTNKQEKSADVFLTDFCSHNIESRRVIVSSSERWKNIIIPILKASDPAGLGLVESVPMDLSLPSWHLL